MEHNDGVAAEVFDLVAIEGDAAGVEQVDAELNKGDEEQQVEGSHDVKAELRSDLAKAEGPGDQDDQQGGNAYGRIDADDEAKGETPGETTRGDPTAQKAEEWAQNFTPEDFAEGVGHVHFLLDAHRWARVGRARKWVWVAERQVDGSTSRGG